MQACPTGSVSPVVLQHMAGVSFGDCICGGLVTIKANLLAAGRHAPGWPFEVIYMHIYICIYHCIPLQQHEACETAKGHAGSMLVMDQHVGYWVQELSSLHRAVVCTMAEEAPEETNPRQAWPASHQLAKTLEQNALVRELFRNNNSHLLKWPKPDLVGVASMSALSLNKMIIKEVLLLWGTVCNEPKSPPVDWLKQEARAKVLGSSHARTYVSRYIYLNSPCRLRISTNSWPAGPAT